MEQGRLYSGEKRRKPCEQQESYKRQRTSAHASFVHLLGHREWTFARACATVPEDAGTRTSKYFVVQVEVSYNWLLLGHVCVLIPFNEPDAEYKYFVDAYGLNWIAWEAIRDVAKRMYYAYFYCDMPFDYAHMMHPRLTEGGHKCFL